MLIPLTIVFALLALLLLLMRFVQPEIIYIVRRGLVMVGINKVFLDQAAGREGLDARYKQLLVQETRYETRTFDADLILQDRVVKISELYRLLDSRRRIVKSQKPQVCIVELGTLLANLGRDVEANPEHNAPIVRAGALLKYIANGVRTSQNEPPLRSEEQIDVWYIDNPITIEQVIELLIAAVVGLAHRQQAASSGGSQVKASDRTSALPEINKLERRLRHVVRVQLRTKYMPEEAIHQRVKESLGGDTYQECLARMENARKHGPEVSLDFFDFLYWGELKTLIVKEWNTFQPIFEEEAWLAERVRLIREVRGEEANNRDVPEEDRRLSLRYCNEIRTRMEKLGE